MSVHTALDKAEVRDLLTMYDMGQLTTLRPLRGQTAHSNFYLKTDQSEYLLRIHEGRSFRDLIYEKEALLYLQKRSLAYKIPEPVANLYGGHFTPISDSRYLSMYRWIPGRSLANWELKPAHCEQAGKMLAQLHQSGLNFKGHRRHPDGPERIFAQHDTLSWQFGQKRPEWWLVAEKMRPHLVRDLGRRVPHSLLHGEFSPANVKVHRGQICALLDFENVARGPILYDLAVALNFWAWTRQQSYDLDYANTLLSAYQRLRPLTALQKSLLLSWMRFAALRFAVSYFSRFEGREDKDNDSQDYYRDFRPFAQRLLILQTYQQRVFAKEFIL